MAQVADVERSIAFYQQLAEGFAKPT